MTEFDPVLSRKDQKGLTGFEPMIRGVYARWSPRFFYVGVAGTWHAVKIEPPDDDPLQLRVSVSFRDAPGTFYPVEWLEEDGFPPGVADVGRDFTSFDPRYAARLVMRVFWNTEAGDDSAFQVVSMEAVHMYRTRFMPERMRVKLSYRSFGGDLETAASEDAGCDMIAALFGALKVALNRHYAKMG